MVRRSWISSIQATLEYWALPLREVKARMRGSFTQEHFAASADLFLACLLVTSALRQVGCRLRRVVIQARGGNKASWVAAAGKPMDSAISCKISEITLSSTLIQMLLAFSSMGPALKQGKASCGVSRQYQAHWVRERTVRLVCSPDMHKLAGMP